MGQLDVLQWLINQRAKGNHKYLTIKEIQKGLADQGFSNGVLKGVGSDLFRLNSTGYVEYKGIGIWKHRKLFRVKDKYKNKKFA